MNKEIKKKLNNIEKEIVITKDKIDIMMNDIRLTFDSFKNMIIDVNKLTFKLEDVEKELKTFISDYEEE